ncbi:MAG TPA: hypothetical protein VFA20_12905 [Myxococcaceae bacterium]|nr:hypothetical protein [Myxococcaceae bacterium]
MGLIGGVRERIRGAVEWVRGIRAILRAMADLERGPPPFRERPADLRELKASPPPRPRPIPAPPRVVGRKVVPVAAKVARAKRPPRPPAPGTKVKRGQKHR